MYSIQTSLIVAALKKMLPIGLNMCTPGDQELISLAKSRYSYVSRPSALAEHVIQLVVISAQPLKGLSFFPGDQWTQRCQGAQRRHAIIFFFFFNLPFMYISFKIYFIVFYFWLCWVFVAAHGLSLVVASGGYSSFRCMGFSLWWLLLLWSMGSRRAGFSSCGTRAQ